MLVLDGYREIAVLSEGPNFRLVRAERDGGATVLVKTATRSAADSSTAEKLRQEFELEQRLHHPAVVEAIDFVVGSAQPALVLADDGGATLRSLLQDGPLPVREAIAIAKGIASGIAELHRHDIVHRDIEPGSIMVGEGGTSIRIVDLGIATVVPRQQAAPLTPGLMLGSLPYISPEQTGRTSRPVDYRSDLYSFGITLFEMLTGRTPFTSSEPLQLVHDHLAVPAARVSELRDAIPRVVDDLVARLLEKDPGDRYRSALGVMRDLERIHDRIVRGLDPDETGLTGIEISTSFQIPDQLFGRSSEMAELEASLRRAVEGRASLLFVHGRSGVGKSSLIEEVRQPVNQLRGYVAMGKTDQLYPGPANALVAQALGDLATQLLTEDDDTIAALRRKLRSVLGTDTSVLTEAVPELAALLRDLTPHHAAKAPHERSAFNKIALQFLSALATPDRPLVLVLDDMQWSGAAATDLIERAVTDSPTTSLLVVASYRDDEIDAAHPVRVLQERLTAAGVEFGDVALGPLSGDAVAKLVSGAVGRTVADAAPLTDLCLRSTGGNPLHIRLFLGSLYESGLLQLDAVSGAWSWDVDAVSSRQPAEHLAELTSDKLRALSEPARELLGVMAVVGAQGDSDLLIEIGIEEALSPLQELAGQDLVELTDDPPRLRWEFAHDRIREATAEIIDAGSRPAWHQRIGEALQLRLTGFQAETTVFAVLRHLNAAVQPGAEPDEGLARMNLEAARRALRSSDYSAALDYYRQGAAVLGPKQWKENPQTSFALHVGAADAARLLADFAEMDRWVELILASASDDERRMEATLRKIFFLSQTGQDVAAVDMARVALAGLGWTLPAAPRRWDVVKSSTLTQVRLRFMPLRSFRLSTAALDNVGDSRSASTGTGSMVPYWVGEPGERKVQGGVASIEGLLELPQMGDRTARTMLRLLNEAMISAYWIDRDILTLMVLKGINICADHGSDSAAALIYAFYGAIVSAVQKDPDTGLAFADTAVRLTRTLGTLSKPSRVRLTRDVLVAPTKVPLRDIEQSLEQAYTRGMDTGDVAFGTSALLFKNLHRLLAGVHLDEVEAGLETAESQLRQHSQKRNVTAALALRQLVHDLRSDPTGGVPFSGPYLDGASYVRSAHEVSDRMTLCWVHTLRAMSRWHCGDVTGARTDIAAGGVHLDAILGQALVPIHHLYGVLAWSTIDGEPTSTTRRVVRAHRRRLAWFAKKNPIQHRASLLLADGAIAVGRQRLDRARRLLGEAAELATRLSMPMTTGMASSLAAAIADHAQDAGAAVRHRSSADDAYRRWGATALIRETDAVAASEATGTDGDALDLATVVRASEAISQEIELDSLLRRLMEVLLQNAGAERGVLFRVDGERVVPEAEGLVGDAADPISVTALEPDDQPEVAESVVRLVARTSEVILMARATDDPLLANDVAIHSRAVRSLLCVPLVTQGRLNGILYLENNQVDGAFTTGRLRLLRILSSQAASALEKARLHDEQRQLIEAQDRFVPAPFLKALGHSNLVDVQRGQGTLKTVDILFSDIRSFTSIVETMSPSEAMEFVNRYLAHMEPIIHEHGGFIDNYEGDSILALFDAGTDAGVRAAIAMAAAERSNNQNRNEAGLPPIHTGFGLNSAGVMMGIVGGVSALRATIIGDAVNVASRVETLTKRYHTTMLISENTAVRLRPETSVTLRPLERVQLVGKTQALQVFEVLDALDDEARSRRLESLDQYNEALTAYERGELAKARRMFVAVVDADPTDSPVAVMLARAESLIASGASLDGPPITRLETKTGLD